MILARAKGIIRVINVGKISMDASKFAAWKYKHEGSGVRSRKQQIIALILFIGALVVHFSFHLLPLSIGLCVIAVLTLLYSTKKIFVGPRYLICGSTIFYYNNVISMALDEASGSLRLVTASDQIFTLQRENFPTNARKADKIKKNKAAKFSKVAQSIIGKVLRATPGVETRGISGNAFTDE